MMNNSYGFELDLDNYTKKDYEVSEEWKQYLIRRNFDDGIED